ncbi:MAG: GNAT family N-acetyltransferase [Defluviitaleaceae bacterium]|nr:GNAT family N-acetyltransferase [Defluviitaleaceae bacterium]
MKPNEATLTTDRLILRPFGISDAEAMFGNWARDPDVVRFLLRKDLSSVDEVREHIGNWMKYFDGLTEKGWDWGLFAIVQKSDGAVIGTIDFAETDREARSAEVAYALGKPWRGRGYMTEALRAVLAHCFEAAGLNRVWATYRPQNPASGKVMANAGMFYEGTFRQSKVRNGERVDTTMYAILKEDWDIQKEIAHYNSLPCEFDGFIDVPVLSDGEIFLVCTEKQPANPEKKYVPGYEFIICKDGEKVGRINLRIGYGGGLYNSNLYYGGQIGYGVDEPFRGNGYAARACRLLLPVAKAHKMNTLLITNNPDNRASMRVCEKLGLTLIRTAPVPKWHDLHKDGDRYSNIYEWQIT